MPRLNQEAQTKLNQIVEELKREKGWGVSEVDNHFAQKATKYVLNHLKRTKGYAEGRGLSREEIEYLVKNNYLNTKGNKFLETLPSYLSNSEVDQLINSGKFYTQGGSKHTFGEFRRGKDVQDDTVFRIFCTIVSLSYRNSIYQESWLNNPSLKPYEKLDLFLGSLNHSFQWNRLEPFTTQSDVVWLWIKNPDYRIARTRWLLKAIMSNINARHPDGLIIRIKPSLSKKSRSYGQNFVTPILEKINKEIADNNHIKKIKEEELNIDRLARTILIEHLKKKHLILVFEDIENQDISYVKAIRYQIWQRILDVFNDPNVRKQRKKIINHSLLMCFLDSGQYPNWRNEIESNNTFASDWQPLIPVNTEVTNQFDILDLNTWIIESDRLGKVAWKEDNRTECTRQIWNQSNNGEPEQLLKAIYTAAEGCNWEKHGGVWTL